MAAYAWGGTVQIPISSYVSARSSARSSACPSARRRLSQEWLTQLGVLASMDAAGKPSLLEVFALAAARRPCRLLPADGPGTSSDCEEGRPDARRGQTRKTPISGSRISARFCDRQQWQKDLHGLRAKVEAATGRLRLGAELAKWIYGTFPEAREN